MTREDAARSVALDLFKGWMDAVRKSGSVISRETRCRVMKDCWEAAFDFVAMETEVLEEQSR